MQRQMKRVIAGAFAVWLVGWAGGFGTAIAASEPAYPWAPGPPPSPSPVGDASTAKVVYALGGARMPGIPWYEYTNQAGSQYFPNAKHDLIDYPAGAAFSWWPTMLLPPGSHQDNMTVGVAVKDGTNSLDNAIHHGTDPAAAVGLSRVPSCSTRSRRGSPTTRRHLHRTSCSSRRSATPPDVMRSERASWPEFFPR